MKDDIKVVTICGSMRYSKEMMKVAKDLEIEKGYSVIQCVYFSAEDKCDSIDEEKLG